jgi:hypothetical protein
MQIIVSLIVAVILSLILVVAFRRRLSWTGTLWFLITTFLASWAGSLWLGPIGPSLRGVYWLPPLLVGSTAGLIFLIFAPRRAPKSRLETLEMLEEIQQTRDMEKATKISFSVFLWVIMFTLIGAIIVRYVLS